jgi:hypothetical protein
MLEASGVATTGERDVVEHVIEHQKQLEDAKYFYSTSRTLRVSWNHLPSYSTIHSVQVTTLDSCLCDNASTSSWVLGSYAGRDWWGGTIRIFTSGLSRVEYHASASCACGML